MRVLRNGAEPIDRGKTFGTEVIYWDARRAAGGLANDPRWIAHRGILREVGSAEGYLHGVWAERNSLNVPGPFYGAGNDTCLGGVMQAPNNVLWDRGGHEFVWRQPKTEEEVSALLDAAYQDPFQGYAWDGDDHWTSDAVEEWFKTRSSLRTWATTALGDPGVVDIGGSRSRDAVLHGLRRLIEYIDGGDLEADLHGYAEWLDGCKTGLV